MAVTDASPPAFEERVQRSYPAFQSSPGKAQRPPTKPKNRLPPAQRGPGGVVFLRHSLKRLKSALAPTVGSQK
jgi:hypothetical protein